MLLLVLSRERTVRYSREHAVAGDGEGDGEVRLCGLNMI